MAEDIRKVVTDLLLWKAKARSIIGELIVWAGCNGLGTERAKELLNELYEWEGKQS